MFKKIRLWMLEQQVKAIVAENSGKKETGMATDKKTAPKKKIGELEGYKKLVKEFEKEIKEHEKKEASFTQLKKDFDEYERNKLIKQKEELALESQSLKLEQLETKLKNYESVQEKIKKNNEIDSQLLKANMRIDDLITEKRNYERTQNQNQIKVEQLNEKIEKNQDLILQIAEEFEKEKIFKVYLEVFGKNGISKIIMKTMMPLINQRIPGSPYGKPELYDVEQLLREKDERMSAQAQMIHSTVGGQMWQLVGAEAPDEVPPNAIPKPNRIATPGPGNEIRTIVPFVPEFQVEDYNRRIDREIAVVTGLNDLLLGLAPTSVLGSSRAIASLVANYEARLAPKRKILYSWMKQVWEMTGKLWSSKDRDIEFILGGEYRIDIVPPELTPRDTLELAQTAINLVQNRIWSAERAMDRVGVEDPEGEKEVIREEQTDATLNPASVLTMGNLVAVFRQLGVAMPGQEDAAAQSMNASRTLNPPTTGTEAMNSPEQQGNPPAESVPGNAQPGVAMAEPQVATEENV